MTSKKFQMDVSGIPVDVIKKDIKNINLAVYPPSGRVRLSSPRSVKNESLRLFLISKLEWIQKQQRKMKALKREPDLEYVQGEGHWVQGDKYSLNVIEEEAPPYVQIRNKEFLDLRVRPGSDKTKREKVIKEWYRAMLKEQIPSLIHKWEKELGVTVQDWGVKQMKTRWGSCNIRAKRIWLSLELAKKPSPLLDYVVLHEIAHLKERLHNNRFKSILTRHMPGWKRRQDELNGIVR